MTIGDVLLDGLGPVLYHVDGDDELEGDELLPDDAQHHAQPPLQPGPARVPDVLRLRDAL